MAHHILKENDFAVER